MLSPAADGLDVQKKLFDLQTRQIRALEETLQSVWPTAAVSSMLDRIARQQAALLGNRFGLRDSGA